MGSRSGVRGDLELGGYLQGASTDSGIDTTSFTATQSSTASSTSAFPAKDKVPWREDASEDPGAVETPPPTPDSLVAGGGGDIPPTSPSAFPLGPDGSLGDADSRSRYAAPPALMFNGTERRSLLGSHPEVRSSAVWHQQRERGIMKKPSVSACAFPFRHISRRPPPDKRGVLAVA